MSVSRGLPEKQRHHWESIYREHPQVYGVEPSSSGLWAAERFARAGAHNVLELGAGHGRDSLWFVRRGFAVTATDYSTEGIEQLKRTASSAELTDLLNAELHDVRHPLTHPSASFDAVYAHLLFSMALSTQDIHAAVREVKRVLAPGGVFVYTVRHTGDADYGQGIGVGDDIWVNDDGIAVHFFTRELVEALALDWQLEEIEELEESEEDEHSRRLWRITQTV